MPTIEVRPGGLVGPSRRTIWRLIGAGALGWLILLAAAPRLAMAVVVVAAWWGLRWLRRILFIDPLAREYLIPVSDTIRHAIAARFRLSVDPEFVKPPKGTRPLSPLEQAVRAWWGTRVEPVVRWLPDRWLAARQAVSQMTAPLLDQVRRPKPPVAARLKIWRPYLTAEQQKFVAAVMAEKVRLPANCRLHWDQHGSKVTATWVPSKPTPKRVGYAELLKQWDKMQETDLYMGESSAGPVVVSLHDDSPHICISAGSGAGKSVLAQLLAVQVLARGGQVIVLDRKSSHRWAVGLPRVIYARTPSQMHDCLIAAAALADERNSRVLDEPEGWDPGPRVLVIAEELNATLDQLRDYWNDVREKGDPKASPAIRALKNLLYMGRSAKINVVAVAQMLTARTIGGPEARENFSVRCLSRFTTNAWRMLAPHVPQPRSSRVVGRWQIVVGGTATETQVAWLSDAESRMFAARGGSGPGPLGGAVPAQRNGSDRASTRDVPGDRLPAGDSGDAADGPVDPLSERLTLRDAVAEGVLPWSHQAAKKRLQRSRNRPQPCGKRGQADLFRRGDLIEWAERESSRAH